MKVPISWLADYIETGLPVKELAHRMTMAGLEAEKFEEIGAIWDNVFVGLVTNVERHPNADRLVLADVDAGEHRLRVVTGAPNIAAGQKVALALAGARLFDGHSDSPDLKTLKPGAIRGIMSEGMVCSEKELGLSAEHEGILVLEDDAPVGAPLRSWLGDTVIEFEITPNLAHAFSINGIAREVRALTALPLRKVDSFDLTQIAVGADDLVTIEDPDLCSRYMALVFTDVTVGPSPEWLARRLRSAGMRPINNIVDVTNYVMHELGQPLHAFDAAILHGGRIIVRRARTGETLETLDHQVRELTPDMLMIADADQPIAIAGVMGGFDTEVKDATTTLLLEGANFDMKSVRRSSRTLKLRSEASARYERGVDPNLVSTAMARAARLILNLSPGARITAIRDVYPHQRKTSIVSVPISAFGRILGVTYTETQIVETLTLLDFDPRIEQVGAAPHVIVTVPTYRQDVTIVEDVVEEVARIIGYDMLPGTLPIGQTPPVQRDAMFQLQRAVRKTIVAGGVWEAVTYVTASAVHLESFTDGEESGFLHLAHRDRLVKLKNSLQADRSILRPTLIPALVEAIASNLKHTDSVRLGELARIYLPHPSSEAMDGRPLEVEIAAIAIAGRRDAIGIYNQVGDLDFFDLKGILDAVLSHLGLSPTVEPTTHPALHPGRAASYSVDGLQIALLGELRPDVAARFGIDEVRVTVAELDLSAILPLTRRPQENIAAPRFLPVEQDFAIVVDETTPADSVGRALLESARPLATDAVLFDIYRGAQIGDGKKSLAYRVSFTAPDRAMTDAELVKVRARIERSLKQKVSGTLRS